MRKIRFILIWMWMLTKRLYKKPAYLALLLFIPVVVFSYSIIAQNDSGMMTIVIALEDPADTLSIRLSDELANSSNIIRFITSEQPDDAVELVYNGVADAAWIIQSNIEKQIVDFVSGSYSGPGFVRVVVREKNVPLMLANEKLSGKLFVHCAKTCFLQCIREEATQVNELSDDQILSYFDQTEFDDGLFEYVYIDNPQLNSNAKNYLLMPIRGLLAVLAVIVALSTAMFYIQDDQDGLFSWVNYSKRTWIEFGYQLIAIGNVMLFVVVALFSAKLNISISREILCAFIYVLCCASFGQLLRLWGKSQHVVSMLLPIIVIVMFVVCPVFISIPGFEYLQLLFPVSYYLHAIYNSQYILYMLIYTICMWILFKISALALKRY